MTFYYHPYSGTYLIDKMRAVSIGLVKTAIFGTTAFIAAAIIYWAAAAVFNAG